jgi:hypothetical protein
LLWVLKKIFKLAVQRDVRALRYAQDQTDEIFQLADIHFRCSITHGIVIFSAVVVDNISGPLQRWGNLLGVAQLI